MPSSTFRPLQPTDLDDKRSLEQYLRGLERHLTTVTDALQRSQAALRNTSAARGLSTSDLLAIKEALEAGGVAQLDLTNIPGIQAESVDWRPPVVSSHPDPYSTPYDTYVLSGSPDSLWRIDRTTNPPTAVQIGLVSAHTLLGTSHSDTLVGTVVRGDLIVGNSTPKWARLAKGGTAYQLLRINAGNTDPEWGAVDDTMLSSNVALENVANTFSQKQTISSGGLEVTGTTTLHDALVFDGTIAKSSASSPYTIGSDDWCVLVNTSTGAVTINLPATVTLGRLIVIKDASGNAGANNITIGGNGNNIDGAASITVATNYASYMIIGSGSDWSVI